MKLPSIQQIITDSSRTFRRFPLVILDAVIGTATALILIDREGQLQSTILFNILFASILGIPLLTTIVLTAEQRNWSGVTSALAQGIGLLALAAYAWSVPSDLADAPSIHVLRLMMIAIALHLFVAVVPYSRRGETNGFWHYNKSLILRVIIAALYTVVLYAGLALALAALDNLFGMDIPPKRYGELWILLTGMFTTWFFLGGVPERLDSLEATTDYPTGIKIFAQYILLPLVLVYLVILYAYLGKILISWDWPQGWVSRLILGFASVGILMHLLFHPIRDRVEHVWIRSASRWFYVTMVPLVVMLLLALWRRISEYGVTEGRYVGVATAFWLALIVLYFIFSKGKSIKAIPASLGIVALLISFGSWGAFNVSESSQVGRLEELLVKTSILVDGKIHPAEQTVPFEETKEISSILQYLHEVHGYDRIQPWFAESLRNDSTDEQRSYKDPSLVATMMGIEYVRIWEGTATNEINLRVDAGRALDVEGYNRLWRIQVSNSGNREKKLVDDGFSYRVSSGLDTLTFFGGDSSGMIDSLRVDMSLFIENLLADYHNANPANIPPEKMSLKCATDRMKVKVYVQHVYGRRQDGVLRLTSYEATILYSPVVM